MDSVIKSDFHYQPHTDTLTHIATQPTENMILERNKRLRNNPGVINDLGGKGDSSWGRQIASIPEIIFNNAIKNGYDLNSRDAKIAAKEMNRFLASPIGRACLVQGKS